MAGYRPFTRALGTFLILLSPAVPLYSQSDYSENSPNPMLSYLTDHPQGLGPSLPAAVENPAEAALLLHDLSMPVVFILKDAHGEGAIQKAIMETVLNLIDRYGVQAVGLEGAYGRLNPSFYSAMPNQTRVREIVEKFVLSGELSGAAAASIFSRRKAAFFGIESFPAYEAAVNAYLAGSDRRLSLEKEMKEIEADLKVFQNNLSPDLRRASEIADSYRAGSFDLYKAVDQMTEMAEKNHMSIPAALFSSLTAVLRYRDSVKAGEPEEQTLSAMPIISASEEMEAFLRFILESLTQTADESRALKLMDHYRKLKKVSRFELRRKEWESFQTLKERLEGPPVLKRDNLAAIKQRLILLEDELKSADSPWTVFYETAGRREDAFVSRFLSYIVQNHISYSVIVTGGFHAEALSRLVREKGCVPVVLTPAAAGIARQNRYAEYMKGKSSLLFFRNSEGMIDLYRSLAAAMLPGILKAVPEPAIPLYFRKWRENLKESKPDDSRFLLNLIDEAEADYGLKELTREQRSLWMKKVDDLIEMLNREPVAQRFSTERSFQSPAASSANHWFAAQGFVPLAPVPDSWMLGKPSPAAALQADARSEMRMVEELNAYFSENKERKHILFIDLETLHRDLQIFNQELPDWQTSLLNVAAFMRKIRPDHEMFSHLESEHFTPLALDPFNELNLENIRYFHYLKSQSTLLKIHLGILRGKGRSYPEVESLLRLLRSELRAAAEDQEEDTRLKSGEILMTLAQGVPPAEIARHLGPAPAGKLGLRREARNDRYVALVAVTEKVRLLSGRTFAADHDIFMQSLRVSFTVETERRISLNAEHFHFAFAIDAPASNRGRNELLAFFLNLRELKDKFPALVSSEIVVTVPAFLKGEESLMTFIKRAEKTGAARILWLDEKGSGELTSFLNRNPTALVYGLTDFLPEPYAARFVISDFTADEILPAVFLLSYYLSAREGEFLSAALLKSAAGLLPGLLSYKNNQLHILGTVLDLAAEHDASRLIRSMA